MATLIDLCNQALAEIAKGQIASLNEGSLEAREAKRFAEPLLLEIIDWSDEMPFGRRRSVLAQMVNDRASEWAYSYAAPSDMASPIAIRAVEDEPPYFPVAGPYSFPMQDEQPIPFLHENGRIYTNAETATLIYATSQVDAAQLPPLLARAFVLELAARMAGPLAKDQKMVQAKAQQAELARQRAIADEENKNPRRATRYISEAEYARMGVSV